MSPPYAESRLIRRLQERDEAAFREIVRTYQDQVYNLVYRMLGNHEEAEDLSQEVFVTVFKSIDSFRGESKFSTWLYRIAVNQCKNRYKYLARRHVGTTRPLDDLTERDAAGPGSGPALHGQISEPDKIMEGKRLEEAIQRAIAALEDDQRLLVVLRDIQGLSYQEIATITQLPEGTVKSKLHRARATLKDSLKPHM